MDSAFIHQAANELVQTAGTRNIKQIARSCSLDISETSRIKDMLGLLSLYFDKPLILINRQLDKQTKQMVCGYALGHYLALTQELRAEDNVIAVIFFTNTCSEANRNRRLDYHDCFWVILNHQLDNCFNRRSIKEILLAVIVSALKFVRRSCSTVAYKAHLLPYVATYPLFRA